MADYPYGRFRFMVEIDGIDAGSFSEATGFDASIEAIEYREGDMPGTPIKIPGLRKYSNIILKKGQTDSTALYDWFEECVDKEIERKPVTITLLNQEDDPVASWMAENAWPVKYTAPEFNATANEIAIEQIEIAHEGLTRAS